VWRLGSNIGTRAGLEADVFDLDLAVAKIKLHGDRYPTAQQKLVGK
jgi:hypothetical protein